jgi:hypothetical protein
MIDREKATAAAEEILTIERSRIADAQNANAPKVPLGLRITGLSALEPRHQAALIREAERAVDRKWSFQAWAIAWVASVAILWYLSSIGQQAFGLIWAMTPALGVLGIRHWFLRRELRRVVLGSTSREALRSEA